MVLVHARTFQGHLHLLYSRSYFGSLLLLLPTYDQVLRFLYWRSTRLFILIYDVVDAIITFVRQTNFTGMPNYSTICSPEISENLAGVNVELPTFFKYLINPNNSFARMGNHSLSVSFFAGSLAGLANLRHLLKQI